MTTHDHQPPAEPVSRPDAMPPDPARLARAHPADIAEVVAGLTPAAGAHVLAAMPPEAAADTLEELDEAAAEALVADMQPDQAAHAVARMAPDDAADLLAELPDAPRERILERLPPAHRGRLQRLMAYPPDSAGGIMSPEVTALPADLTTTAAIARLRQIAGASEQIYYTYVVDAEQRLVGVLSLRDLILAPPERRLRDIMRTDLVTVPVHMDREEVARCLSKYGYYALPVVDPGERLLGIVTVDDVVDVLEAEATEDMHRMVGAGIDEHLDSPVAFVLRRRVPWLLVNLVTAFVAASVVSAFQGVIAELTVLAVLMPVVAGMAGNSGLQSMAVTIRSIATGQTRGVTLAWLVLRGAAVGFGSGALLGATCGVVAFAWQRDGLLALVLGGAMALCVLIATVAGALVPWGMRRLGFDPAQSASIILTTITDITGFGIFLALGSLLLLRAGT